MFVLVGKLHFTKAHIYQYPDAVAEAAAVANSFTVFAADTLAESDEGGEGNISVDVAAYLLLAKDRSTMEQGLAFNPERMIQCTGARQIAIVSGQYESTTVSTLSRLKAKQKYNRLVKDTNATKAESRNHLNRWTLRVKGYYLLIAQRDHLDATDALTVCGSQNVSCATIASLLANRDVTYKRSWGSKNVDGNTGLAKFMQKFKKTPKSMQDYGRKSQATLEREEKEMDKFIDDEVDETI